MKNHYIKRRQLRSRILIRQPPENLLVSTVSISKSTNFYKTTFSPIFAQNDVSFSTNCSKSLTASLKNVTFLWMFILTATRERSRFFPTNWKKNFNVLTIGYRVFKTDTKILLISAYPWLAIISWMEATRQTNYGLTLNFNIDLDGFKILAKKRRFFSHPSLAIISCLQATPQTNYGEKTFFFWEGHSF